MSADAQRQLRLQLETRCSNIGRALAKQMPPHTGFVLVMFDFGDPEEFGRNMAYCSTGVRADCIAMLEELLGKIKAEGSDS